MQMEVVERFEDLSSADRRKLKKQIGRVQKEARQLRKQARQLRAEQMTTEIAQTDGHSRGLFGVVLWRNQPQPMKDEVEVEQKVSQPGLLRQLFRGTSGKEEVEVSKETPTPSFFSSFRRRDQQVEAMPEETPTPGFFSPFRHRDQQDGMREEEIEERQSGLLGQFWKRGQQAMADKTDEMERQVRSGALTQAGKEWGQNMFKRGGELTSSGLSYAGEQLKSGQQMIRERGGETAQNMMGWRDDASFKLRKQGRNLARGIDDLRDETAYQLRRQGRSMTYKLGERRDEAAHKLRKQGRYIGRDIADRRDEARLRLMRQGQMLADQKDRLLARYQKALPFIGFFSGLFLAAGLTFWFLRRSLLRNIEVEEESSIELKERELREQSQGRPSGRIFFPGRRGGTAVATRPETVTAAPSRFVGVRSTGEYYPISRTPNADAEDLVFFTTEEDAKTEGYRLARR